MSTNEVIVVIPYYRSQLSESELFSLEKGLKVFSQYPISFVMPDDIEVPTNYQHVKKEIFASKYFKGLKGYNQLLLSDHFYKRFLDYKFILIYQLDALVFNDELKYWCSLDYDYCGAPWNKEWKKRYYNFYGMLTTKVGNGGFSLRKTEVFYKMTKRIKAFKTFIRFGEDIFWCTYGKLVYSKLKIIDYDRAIRFAFESQPERLYHLNDNKLPFGCHAFEKNNLPFWKRIVVDLPQ